MFLGLRSVIYPAPDLQAAKAATTALLGVQPYFDEAFYVGFSAAGYELGLDPNLDPGEGPVTYWGVSDIEVAMLDLSDRGATTRTPVQDVGGGIRTVTLEVPALGLVGLIQNPHYEPVEVDGAGPGR
ncbi:VOC family protein [Naasia lichenicola]|uniref:VOC family protein n=1 Tax=Naasia lichenicola TaxID=2565933 RepID=A0A4S4FSG5_9MICO|nr:VOC family protein [Naasia lichenicola]THG33344.1 VOC family protein [Naasia lichenicola]